MPSQPMTLSKNWNVNNKITVTQDSDILLTNLGLNHLRFEITVADDLPDLDVNDAHFLAPLSTGSLKLKANERLWLSGEKATVFEG